MNRSTAFGLQKNIDYFENFIVRRRRFHRLWDRNHLLRAGGYDLTIADNFFRQGGT